jgi:hypothetical protein
VRCIWRLAAAQREFEHAIQKLRCSQPRHHAAGFPVYLDMASGIGALFGRGARIGP